MKLGFDNDLYLKMQSTKILERVKKFENKLYLEFGGKLFDDYHASRVLPGFEFDSKLKLLMGLKNKLEVIFCINAADIEKNKMRSDLGITYELDVMRLIDKLRELGILVNSVVITQYKNQPSALLFKKKLERRNISTYFHTFTKGYPTDVDMIVSEEGYGANPYVPTTKEIVVITAPGPGSGKLATCLSQLYHEYKRGTKAGYAKFETFPVWNLDLKHPVNLAYEAATADLKDKNMIDNFHLQKYNQVAINYNRDLEVFPVVKNILDKIMKEELYFSPTDMGVNTVGSCIIDDEEIRYAAKQEIIRRYYNSLCDYKKGIIDYSVCEKIKMLLNELNISELERVVVTPAIKKYEETSSPAIALSLQNGKIILGRTNEIMTAASSVVLNAIKELAGINDKIHLLSPSILKSIRELKKNLNHNGEKKLCLQEVLIGLSIMSNTNPTIELALSKLGDLKNLEAHSTYILNPSDDKTFKNLNINITSEPVFYLDKLYED